MVEGVVRDAEAVLRGLSTVADQLTLLVLFVASSEYVGEGSESVAVGNESVAVRSECVAVGNEDDKTFDDE